MKTTAFYNLKRKAPDRMEVNQSYIPINKRSN